MAQYSDYLKYLNHVDDTTLQDFKVKEDALRQEITDTKNQCRMEVKATEEKYKTEIEKQKSLYKVNISDIKQQVLDKEFSHQRILAKLKNDHEEEIKKITSELERCQQERDTLNHKANIYESYYNAALQKLKFLSTIRLIFILIVSIGSLGILPVVYFIYWIFNYKNYFSVLRWIECDKYDTPMVAKYTKL